MNRDKNYFYCPECGFEYEVNASEGFFGEAVHRVIPSNFIDGRQIDYLMHCPKCNKNSCGVIRVDGSLTDRFHAQAVIGRCKEMPALKNAP